MPNAKIRKVHNFNFQPFSAKQMKLLNWWSDDSPVKNKFMCIADGSVRSGKELRNSAKLYTPDGYKLMGDIKVGDYVLDRLGRPTQVIGVFPQGIKDVYRVTFHDGSSCECGKEHLWSYTTKKCISNKNYTVFTSTLSDIMLDLERHKNKKHMHQRAGKYRFPLAKCVQFNDKPVDIDPYLLGLLLGDGCFTDMRSSRIEFTNDELELHDYVRNSVEKLGMGYKFYPKNGEHCARGNLLVNYTDNPIKKALISYGLWGKYSYNKFIPTVYKYNSKDIRLEILAGLLNTDGYVLNNRPSISYCSTSKQLVEDIAEIARSLGYFCNTDRTVDSRPDKGKHDCYSCSIRITEELYDKLSTKHRVKVNLNPTKHKEWRMIKSIEYIGKYECTCIYVDNEEHLYLTDDFIVTHNTISICLSFLLYVMSKFNQQNVAIAGKSVGSVRRNVITPLKGMLLTLGYEYIEHRSENYLEIIKGDITNYFFLFGLKDETSSDHIQGITLAGAFIDSQILSCV